MEKITTRQTKQKAAIVLALEQAQRPLSPAEILAGAKSGLASISLATVYRVVRALVDDGTIVAVSLPGAPDRYETHACAAHHHHHFHCDDCGRVFDVPGCGLRVNSPIPAGFSLKRHEVVLYGSCNECGVGRV
jgi:Fur family ferric uptake transcriptional regulator